MKKFLLLAFVIFLTSTISHAANLPFKVGVEPIIGYERTQKLVPTPHTKDRLIYGVRLTAGIPLVAAEAEATRGTDTESFPTQDLSTSDQADKVKVGLRSSLKMSSMFNFNLRAGAQAKRNTHEETTAGITTQTITPFEYKPYAGAGFSARLNAKSEFTAGLTVVFHDFPSLSQSEYETTAGFRVAFP